MKIFKEAFGQAALKSKLEKKGFGTKSREEELLKQKEERDARHAKADAEMAERDRAWKAKYSNNTKD